MKRPVTIHLDEEVFDILSKRAKKELMDEHELVEDIVRRSMRSYKKNRGKRRYDKIDDKLIAMFSRERRGRKRK